jgi:hypothetical protein
MDFLVSDTGEGSKTENLPAGKAVDGVEDDDHGVVGNRCHTPYLVRQMSVLGTGNTLWGVLRSAFGRTATSISNRWYVQSTSRTQVILQVWATQKRNTLRTMVSVC